MNDSKAAKLNHERGSKHQENLARSEYSITKQQVTCRAAIRACCCGPLQQHRPASFAPSTHQYTQNHGALFTTQTTHPLTFSCLTPAFMLPLELRDMSRKADTEKKEAEQVAAAFDGIEKAALKRFEADQQAAQEAAGKWVWMEDSQYYYNAKHRYVSNAGTVHH
jgi:hypothetical protein